MSKKNRRTKRASSGRYEARVTPSHYIRLSRIKLTVDAALRWYVVRLDSRKERETERQMREAGFSTCRAVETDLSRVDGIVREAEQRPVAGYLFVGFPDGVDGREQLWSFHDAYMARLPPVSLPNADGELVEVQTRAMQDRPFVRVMGPFDGEALRRFVQRLKPALVAALWQDGRPVFTFPARSAQILERETVGLSDPTARAA